MTLIQQRVDLDCTPYCLKDDATSHGEMRRSERTSRGAAGVASSMTPVISKSNSFSSDATGDGRLGGTGYGTPSGHFGEMTITGLKLMTARVATPVGSSINMLSFGPTAEGLQFVRSEGACTTASLKAGATVSTG